MEAVAPEEAHMGDFEELLDDDAAIPVPAVSPSPSPETTTTTDNEQPANQTHEKVAATSATNKSMLAIFNDCGAAESATSSACTGKKSALNSQDDFGLTNSEMAAHNSTTDSDARADTNRDFKIEIGMVIMKQFWEGDKYYEGKVVGGPSELLDAHTGAMQLVWHVLYEDGDEEDLSGEEIGRLLVQNISDDPKLTGDEDEVDATNTTDASSPPRGQKRSRDPAVTPSASTKSKRTPKSSPIIEAKAPNEEESDVKMARAEKGEVEVIGTIVEKKFEDGKYYIGRVVSGPEEVKTLDGKTQQTWCVRYDEDGDKEDMTLEEIQKWIKTDKRSNPNANSPKKSSKQTSRKKCSKETLSLMPKRIKIKVGLRFEKEFENGALYLGRVIGGPEEVMKRGVPQLTWRVKYTDGDEEDLTTDELQQWVHKPKATRDSDAAYSLPPVLTKATTRQAARQALLSFPGLTEHEIDAALEEIGQPPYGLQLAMHIIHEHRNRATDSEVARANTDWEPKVGMRVRKMLGGWTYWGTVTALPEPMSNASDEKQYWEVTFDDGDAEDMDWYELIACRADRSVRPNPVRGRQLAALELFSGCSIVSQEFAERKWKVKSFDNSPSSYATNKVSVMDLQRPSDASTTDQISPEDACFGLGTAFGVPDFIWASPPCFTYSLLAGGKHRSTDPGLMEKTQQAHEQNHLFVRMAEILCWAKERHPHLIFVIENPVGLLSKMPLMNELVEKFKLFETRVDYCAFGREDKKPTALWTNDFGLHSTLKTFTCENSDCPYSGSRVTHPISARKDGYEYNAAAIPLPLAEEVAEYVNAKFYMDRIRYTTQATS